MALSRRTRSLNSRSTSDCVRPTISALATTTRSNAWSPAGPRRRKLSLSRRRARLRTTAPPSLFPAAMPRRCSVPPLGTAIIMNCRPSRRRPFRKTWSNSARACSRRLRSNSRPICVAGLSPSGGQALPPLLPPPLQDQTTAPGPHADQEAVRPLSLPVPRLKRPLHGDPLSPRPARCVPTLVETTSLGPSAPRCQRALGSSPCTLPRLYASVRGLRTANNVRAFQ